LALVDAAPAGTPAYADFDIVSVPAGSDPEAVVSRLAAQPDVAYAQPRYVARPRFVPNDPLYSRQWNYPAIDMERAWDLNQGASPAVTVAVLDSGVAYRSALLRYFAFPFTLNGVAFPSLGVVDVPFAAAPDLGSADRFVAPRDFIWDDDFPLDLSGHGTHVAGTIGQSTNNGVGGAGMAFNVRIMPVKVVADVWDLILGSPSIGTDDVVARGIRYAVDNGAHVLNLSIGRDGGPAPAVQEALAYAVSRGAFVSLAAGNDFLAGNPVQRFAEIGPRIDGVVSVGAIARDRRRARYSSTGAYVELAAPGGDQVSGGTEGGVLQQTFDLGLVHTFLRGPSQYGPPRFDAFTYTYFQGTSMAAPHVSGFAALLMQQGITTPAAIEAAMKRYAVDLGPAGRDDEYGEGLINPRASLRGMGLAR
jgi:serine protease